MKITMRLVVVFMIVSCMLACKKYADYEVGNNISTVYFAYQKPVRTIVATNGQATFDVGVVLGGVRSNTKNVEVGFKIAPELLNDPSIMAGKDYQLLPASYYTLSDNSKMVVSSGSFEGGVTVKLTQAFLDDPNSYKYTYVLPLKIVSSTSDSILKGAPEDGIAAKDYTVMVVKYINQYDATYYHRGFRYGFDANGNPTDTFQYVKPEEEVQYLKNYVWSLTTSGPNSLVTDGIAYNSSATNANYSMQLTVASDKSVAISNLPVSLIHNVVDNGGSQYDSTNQRFYLYYQYLDALSGKTYKMKDTMIFRNQNLSLETW